jgi:hypothetical protein
MMVCVWNNDNTMGCIRNLQHAEELNETRGNLSQGNQSLAQELNPGSSKEKLNVQ